MRSLGVPTCLHTQTRTPMHGRKQIAANLIRFIAFTLAGAGIKELAAGAEHSLALTKTGDVLAWGGGATGALGLGGKGQCNFHFLCSASML